MSSMLSSQGMVLATAMALSGTVILLAFRLQKSSLTATQYPLNHQIHQSPPQMLRSCISSETKKKEKKSKKRVHFAEDVMGPTGNSKPLRSISKRKEMKYDKNGELKGMPANRIALYHGILRDRVVHRLACSY